MNEQLNFPGMAEKELLLRQFSSYAHMCPFKTFRDALSELRENHSGWRRILNNFYVQNTIYAFYYVRTT